MSATAAVAPTVRRHRARGGRPLRFVGTERALEDIVELEDKARALDAAEGDLRTQGDAAQEPDAHTNAVVVVEVVEIEIVPLERHLSRVIEKGAGQEGVHVPAILRLQQQQIPIAQ